MQGCITNKLSSGVINNAILTRLLAGGIFISRRLLEVGRASVAAESPPISSAHFRAGLFSLRCCMSSKLTYLKGGRYFMKAQCYQSNHRQRMLSERRHRKRHPVNYKGRYLKKGSGERTRMYSYTVKNSEARKSVTVRAENHKEAARSSGLVLPGTNLTVEGPGGNVMWRRYQVDRSGKIKEIANYSA